MYALRASGQVSGDWRRIGGKLRLVGLLTVNVPGYPVPRQRALIASGLVMSLVAAGSTSAVVHAQLRDEATRQRELRSALDALNQRVHAPAVSSNSH